jgi:tripartite-type tricarboxylate transporter receptor subunit TctC
MSARSMVTIVSAGLALLAAIAGSHAAEISYPTKPIRFIVPFPPGGSADPLARALGAWFSDKFGVPVVADNRPGAGTAIAHTLGAKASPDGYTLLLGASSGLTTNPAFGNKLEYDPIKDYAPVGLGAYVPQLVVEFSKHVESIGMEPVSSSTPEELRVWVRSELARWTKVVRDAGIQVSQ